MMPSISFGLKVTVSCVLLVTLNIALFCMNFSFIVRVFCSLVSNILVIAIPIISSTNGASRVRIFYCFGFRETFSFRKKGMDMFKKFTQESCESIKPSNLNRFLMPITRSTFSWISETSVKILNL